MDKIKKIFSNMSNSKKIIFIVVMIAIGLFIILTAPSLARLIRSNDIEPSFVWDGSVATSYRMGNGSEEDPYVISNGAELAYFRQEAENNDYEDTYFILDNNIILNNGIFNYSQTKEQTYTIDNKKYFIKENTTEYYEDSEFSSEIVDNLNNFLSINNFKGNFDGQGNSIFGLYMISENDELALFSNLEGILSNIYLDNVMIFGGNITSSIAINVNNAIVDNVLVDGFVLNKNSDFINQKEYEIDNQNLSLNFDIPNQNIPFSLDYSLINGDIVNTKLSGKLVINEEQFKDKEVSINDQVVTTEEFVLDLNNTLIDNLNIVATDLNLGDEITIALTNLKYEIEYNNSLVSGLFANVENATITGAINKAYIEGNLLGGGLIGQVNGNLTLSKSYSDGLINATNISGGLIGSIENNQSETIITECYNHSTVMSFVTGSLIGSIKNNVGELFIENSFNATTSPFLFGKTENVTINSNQVYYLENTDITPDLNITGNFFLTNLEFYHNKNNLINELGFEEYIKEPQSGYWVFNENALPSSYFDGDIEKPLINIYAGTNSWSRFKTILKPVKFNNNITFNIEKNNELSKVKEISYYISNQAAPLSVEELNEVTFLPYENIVILYDEGYYVIYAKYKDYNDIEGYINSDLLVIGNPDAESLLTLNEYTWNNFNNEPNKVYINNNVIVSAQAIDHLVGIKSIKYYISDNVLDSASIAEIESSNWISYEDGIYLTNKGKYIIYLEVTNNEDQKNYINSDIIIYDGYNSNNLIIGNEHIESNMAANITSLSSIKLDFTYTGDIINLEDYKHIITTSEELPLNTKIILKDNIKNKVYYYFVNSFDKEISLTNFKEVGTNEVSKNFIEDLYISNDKIIENFTVMFDFEIADISRNYSNLKIALNLLDVNDKLIRPTLENNLRNINIYFEANSSVYLNSEFADDIYLNSESLNILNINTGINYVIDNENIIYDSQIDNKYIGLTFKLVDSNNQLIDKNLLNSLVIKYDNQVYHFADDNLVHINLEDIINKTSELTIITLGQNIEIPEGTYYLKINSYLSYDGYIIQKLSESEISLPVIVENNNEEIIEYSFDVSMEETKRIISKSKKTEHIGFNILQNGNLSDPNIKVSLYKKDTLSAYNQNYSIIDLSLFIEESLESVSGFIYYAVKNPLQYDEITKLYNSFNVTIKTSELENTSYKFVFELYDANKKINTIEKYFIVRQV